MLWNSTWTNTNLIDMESDSVDVINQSQGFDLNGVYRIAGSRTLDQLAAGRADKNLWRSWYQPVTVEEMRREERPMGIFAPTKQVKNAFVVANLATLTRLANGSSETLRWKNCTNDFSTWHKCDFKQPLMSNNETGTGAYTYQTMGGTSYLAHGCRNNGSHDGSL